MEYTTWHMEEPGCQENTRNNNSRNATGRHQGKQNVNKK